MALFLVEEDEQVVVTRGYYVNADTLDEAISFVVANKGADGNAVAESWQRDYAGDGNLSYTDSRQIDDAELVSGNTLYDAKTGRSQQV